MTNIRTIDDLIDVIQTDAEVRQRMVAALDVSSTDAQEKVLGSVDRLTKNVDRLSLSQDELTKNVDRLSLGQDELTKNVDRLSQRQDELAKNVDGTKNVDGLTKNVDELTKNVDKLSLSQDELARNLVNLTSTVGDLAARVLGNDTEDRAVDKIISDLGVLFRGVRGTRLMYAHHGRLGFNDDYGQIIQAARDNNEIEQADYRRLVSTDIVFSARRDGRIHLFPAEVSNTLAARDVDQAAKSSLLISQVFRNKVGSITGTKYGDLAVQPLVAGVIVPDLVQDHADSLDVDVVTVNVPTMRSDLDRQS